MTRDRERMPAERLRGLPAPAVELRWTTYADKHELLGSAANTSLARLAKRGTTVVYFFPRDETERFWPVGGEDTLGRAFHAREDAIRRCGAQIVGVSAQTAIELQRLAADELFSHLLLADDHLALADALRLPTVEMRGREEYELLTLILREGRIARVFYPVSSPGEHVAKVLAWLTQHTTSRRVPRAQSWPGVPDSQLGHVSASLMRGLSILNCFTPEWSVRSATDIAQELGIPVPTVRRYATTLALAGYLTQLPDGGGQRQYRLGLRVTDLGLAAVNATGVCEHARPHLERLRAQTTHAASLAALDGPEIVYLEHIPSHRHAHGVTSRAAAAGSRLPAYCTALGKALLAYLPADERNHLVEETTLREHTPATITNRQGLLTELADVRDARFALSDQEYLRDMVALAAPVRDASGHVVAAVGICARTSETTVDELIAAALPELQTAAMDISTQLGYRERDPKRRDE